MDRRAAIIRWTGAGRLADLVSTVEYKLTAGRLGGKVWAAGGSIVVSGSEPVRTCALFQHLPGASWLAAGYEGEEADDLTKGAALLAERYLHRRSRFAVEAQEGASPSADLAGAVMAKILDAAPGARVSARSPDVRFRAAMDRDGGVVGVELFQGPGGIPTGKRTAACLVSGGMHSAVLAWHSVLMGYNVTLVHAKADEGSLVEVAKLYSELSHRADPRGLKLLVLEGGTPAEMTKRFLSEAEAPDYGGVTAAGNGPPAWASGSLVNPLYLLPEEDFRSRLDALGLRGVVGATDWGAKGAPELVRKWFGGVTADISEVLDRLE